MVMLLWTFGTTDAEIGFRANKASFDAKAVKRALVIEGTTDDLEVTDLITDFMRIYPDLTVRYAKISSIDIVDHVVRPASPDTVPDIAWSSAMDLQIKLANDGYALQYHSSEAHHIPLWAQWNDYAYAVTAEPLVFIYNKHLLTAADVPQDHAQLRHALVDQPTTFLGKIATYDPQRSGSGTLFITQDLNVTRRTWDLVAAMGRNDVRLFDSSADMIERVSSGELIFAYNVLGSYAKLSAVRGSDLGIVAPQDYTLLTSRIVLIPRTARHPEAAKRFVDYLLSKAGQTILANHLLMSVRNDMPDAAPGSNVTGSALRPIPMNIDLLTYLDQAKRSLFLEKWRSALKH